jgi:hypothetical protein
MVAPDLWSGFFGVLIGTVLSTAIPVWREWQRRRVERRGEIDSMFVELRLADLSLQELKTKNIPAPLYRLPITMFERAVPKLVGEGLVSLNEHGALIEYINRVEELNRGLERAGEAHAAGRDVRLAEEFERNRLKAEMFFNAERRLEDKSLSDAVKDTVLRLNEEFRPVEVILPWGGLPCVLSIPRLWSSDRAAAGD